MQVKSLCVLVKRLVWQECTAGEKGGGEHPTSMLYQQALQKPTSKCNNPALLAKESMASNLFFPFSVET